MRFHLRLFAVAGTLLAVLSAGCGQTRSTFEARLDVLDTFAEISIAGLPDAEASAAVQAVEQDLERLDHVGYTFAPEGELHELNEAISQGKSQTVSPELGGLLAIAGEIAVVSDGLVNPAAGEMIALWEFHCDKADCIESPYPKDVQQLVKDKGAAIAATHPSMQDISLEGNNVTSGNRSVRLEFGDIIRGYALDKGIEHLKNLGIANAMIDIGGSVRSTGSRGDHPWWFPVRDASGVHSVGFIELNADEAIATVRAFDQSIGKQDFVYRHVVDPRSGLAVRDIKAVTVIHDTAVWANAAATALLVAGIDDWASIAGKMGVRAVMMITRDGTIYTSTTMEERIFWNEHLEHQHLVP